MIRSGVFFVAVSLAGCTTATSTKMVTANTAQIRASEIGGSAEVINQRALRLAAKTALAHGFDYFGVLSKQEMNAADSDSWSGAIGNGNPTPPMRHVYREPSVGLEVRFLHASELPADRDGIYRAAAVLAANGSTAQV